MWRILSPSPDRRVCEGDQSCQITRPHRGKDPGVGTRGERDILSLKIVPDGNKEIGPHKRQKRGGECREMKNRR